MFVKTHTLLERGHLLGTKVVHCAKLLSVATHLLTSSPRLPPSTGQGALLFLLESALPDTILLITMLSTSDTWVTQVMELAWMAFR